MTVFPMHSTHHLQPKFDATHFLAKINEIRSQFDSVRICLYWADFKPETLAMYESEGFEIVTAGHMFDPQFLSRLKSIIHLSDLTMCNHIGTSVFYSIHERCPVYVIEDNIESEGHSKHGKEYIDANLKDIQYRYNFRKHMIQLAPELTSPELIVSQNEINVVGDLVGSEQVRTPGELQRVFQLLEDLYTVSIDKRNPFQSFENLIDLYERQNRTDELLFLKKEMDNIEVAAANTKYLQTEFKFDAIIQIDTIKDLIDQREYDRASLRLNQLKFNRDPIYNTDYYRALCFLGQGLDLAAYQSVLEELRYFPNHPEALQLKDQLASHQQGQIQDPEFQEIYQVIKDYTMVGEPRLYALFTNAKNTCLQNIPGDFVECGVAAGGTSALIAHIIKKYTKIPRKLYCFDSFEGMPQPSNEDVDRRGIVAEETGWGTGTCAAPIDSLKEVATKLDCWELMEPVKGYFNTTLPIYKEKMGPIAFLHMDSDWYESTMDILKNIYHKVNQRGYIQVDDYGFWEGCKKAIHEWEHQQGTAFELQKIDSSGVCFLKPKDFDQAEYISGEINSDKLKDQERLQHLNLIENGLNLFEKKQFEQALRVLNEAKVFRRPEKNLDYLRALCFSKINQPMAAYQVALEELRYFPDNLNAQRLIDQLQINQSDKIKQFNDPEFIELYQVINKYTMVGEARLFALFQNAKRICIEDMPGNFVECGVAAGGTSAILAYVIKHYSKRTRKLFSFDSFEGMPEPTEKDTHKGVGANDTGWGTGTCAAPEDSLKDVLEQLGCLEYVETVKGYFNVTLPIYKDKIGLITCLHMDSDWYESTMDILTNLYDKVSIGAYIQVDDYGFWDGCHKAIDQWLQIHPQTLSPIDSSGVYFIKKSNRSD
jgi:hypothetical protein